MMRSGSTRGGPARSRVVVRVPEDQDSQRSRAPEDQEAQERQSQRVFERFFSEAPPPGKIGVQGEENPTSQPGVRPGKLGAPDLDDDDWARIILGEPDEPQAPAQLSAPAPPAGDAGDVSVALAEAL